MFREELRNAPHVFLSYCLIGLRAHGREKKPDLQQAVVRQRWFLWGVAAIVSLMRTHCERMRWAVPAGSSCSFLLFGNLCLPLTAFTAVPCCLWSAISLSFRDSTKAAPLFFPSPLLHYPNTWRAAAVYSSIISLKRDDLWRKEANGSNFQLTNCSHMAGVQVLRCWTCAAVICCRVRTAQMSFANVWHLTKQPVDCQLQMTSPSFTTFCS